MINDGIVQILPNSVDVIVIMWLQLSIMNICCLQLTTVPKTLAKMAENVKTKMVAINAYVKMDLLERTVNKVSFKIWDGVCESSLLIYK